jgi:iron-chelate-transporting ATPase
METDLSAKRAQTLFALERVTFSVSNQQLLQPLTLEFEPGRVVGLIGHNGSGKSTLLKLLARQQPASSGKIHFDGKPLSEWNRRAFARKVAYLPQQTPQTSGLLVKDVVALGRYPWHGALGRFGPDDETMVRRAMALTNVEGLADRPADELSGGERQRVWLAMLVAQNAECLLLDEPISALDVLHQIEVLSLVQRLSHSTGIAVVMVLHDVNMAARFCDEIVALHSGRLIAKGAPSDIIATEPLKRIYGLEMDVISNPSNGFFIAAPR